MLSCLLVFGCGTVASAAESEKPVQPCASSSVAQPQADVIRTKYRVYNHKLQKRRWNETRGYWVDPYWITIAVAE